jgi:hypothetical protein
MLNPIERFQVCAIKCGSIFGLTDTTSLPKLLYNGFNNGVLNPSIGFKRVSNTSIGFKRVSNTSIGFKRVSNTSIGFKRVSNKRVSNSIH